MIQVDETSRISFFDGKQGLKQCTSQIDITPDQHPQVPPGTTRFNCVRSYGHEGLHESHDGDTCWRDVVTREVFRKVSSTRETENS